MRNSGTTCHTRGGAADPSIAIAAARAGAWGVLDLELALDATAAAAAVLRVDRLGRAPFGVKFDGRRTAFLDAVTRVLPERARLVVLTPGDEAELGEHVRRLHGLGIEVLLEAASVAE